MEKNEAKKKMLEFIDTIPLEEQNDVLKEVLCEIQDSRKKNEEGAAQTYDFHKKNHEQFLNIFKSNK